MGTFCHSQMILVPDVCLPFNVLIFFQQDSKTRTS